MERYIYKNLDGIYLCQFLHMHRSRKKSERGLLGGPSDNFVWYIRTFREESWHIGGKICENFLIAIFIPHVLGNIINQFKSARFCARKLQILNTLETVAHLIFKTGIYIPAVSTITEKPFNQISFRHFIIKNFHT